MRHTADPASWPLYRALPPDVRDLADKNFQFLKRSRQHPSLHYKKVKARDGLWSARVGRGYRALALEQADGFHCFWIGSHADYNRIISNQRLKQRAMAGRSAASSARQSARKAPASTRTLPSSQVDRARSPTARIYHPRITPIPAPRPSPHYNSTSPSRGRTRDRL